VYWGIILKASNSLVGAIGLWNFSQKEKKAEIGFELMPEYQGRGLMMEALSAVIDYGFDKMKLEIITASTHKENIKSVAVLLKNNFQLDSSHVPVNQLNSNDFDEYILSRGHL
jgi:ribosomal-protein-alanine N-acetyltransferase